MIASTKAMPSAFRGIRGVTLRNWLHHSASLTGADFDENILWPMAFELHAGEKKKHCQWPLLYMSNAQSHTSKRNLVQMEELRLKCVT
jgi:hypothetical protein